MSGPTSVSLTMPCPACGRDCTWNGSRTEPNHGTEYRILCANNGCTAADTASEEVGE